MFANRAGLDRILGKGVTPEIYLEKLLKGWRVNQTEIDDHYTCVLGMLSLAPHPYKITNKQVWGNCDFYKKIEHHFLKQIQAAFKCGGVSQKLLGVTNAVFPSMQLRTMLFTLNLEDALKKDKESLVFANRLAYMAYVDKKEKHNAMSLRKRVDWLKANKVPLKSISKLLIFLVPFIIEDLEQNKTNKE